jgi:hypothetical protein
MTNRKISDLAALTAPATGDLLPIVDISEAAAADKNKKITYGELLASAAVGSAAAPSFSFDGDSNTGIFNPGPDTLAFAEGGVEALRIDSSGRIGIGTTGPNAALDVRSATTWIGDGATDAFLQFNQSATAANRWHIGTGPSNALIFYKGTYGTGSETARIDSSGRLLVGTSTTGLQNTRSMLWQGSGEATLYINHSTSDGSGDPFIKFGYNAGQIGSITQSGTTAVAYNTSSDYRLKENISSVSDGITRLLQLKPSRFNFITDPDRCVDGFIAHEAQAVVPECVTGEKDAVDDDGNPVYQGIDQSKLVPLLTAALQEAIGEIESLKARVVALEGA